jgi:carbonic anhydrase
MDAKQAIERLKQGNARFVEGKPSAKNLTEQRKSLTSGQKPFAIVLTCSDSRVCPEHIFDAGLGEIFVVRTAGNIADAVALGSMEYAAEHLGCQALLVMGHTSCGAVNAACASDSAPGNIDTVVKELQGAVARGGKDQAKTVEQNVQSVMQSIRARSHILSHLEKEGKLSISGAVYSLASGEVRQL